MVNRGDYFKIGAIDPTIYKAVKIADNGIIIGRNGASTVFKTQIQVIKIYDVNPMVIKKKNSRIPPHLAEQVKEYAKTINGDIEAVQIADVDNLRLWFRNRETKVLSSVLKPWIRDGAVKIYELHSSPNQTNTFANIEHADDFGCIGCFLPKPNSKKSQTTLSAEKPEKQVSVL